jgi:hypothetical protein
MGALVRPPERWASVLWRKGLVMMQLDLSFCRLVVCVWAVETHASCSTGMVNVGTQHVPALAQMQDSVMPLCGPTLGCDSNPFFLRHLVHSLSRSQTWPVTRLQKNESYAQRKHWLTTRCSCPCPARLVPKPEIRSARAISSCDPGYLSWVLRRDQTGVWWPQWPLPSPLQL